MCDALKKTRLKGGINGGDLRMGSSVELTEQGMNISIQKSH